MRTPKIYLETTIFNHYFDTDRDSHPATLALFNDIKKGTYKAYTSIYVTDELNKASEPKRSKMLELIREYDIILISADVEAQNLANTYVNEGVIPLKYQPDGLHIAIATINDIELLISVNYQHINKLKTKTMTGLINLKQGYKPIMIVTPMEIVDDENI